MDEGDCVTCLLLSTNFPYLNTAWILNSEFCDPRGLKRLGWLYLLYDAGPCPPIGAEDTEF